MNKNNSKKSKQINKKSQNDRDSNTSSISSVNSNIPLRNETAADGFTIGSLKVHHSEHDTADKSDIVTMTSNINVTQI